MWEIAAGAISIPPKTTGVTSKADPPQRQPVANLPLRLLSLLPSPLATNEGSDVGKNRRFVFFQGKPQTKFPGNYSYPHEGPHAVPSWRETDAGGSSRLQHNWHSSSFFVPCFMASPLVDWKHCGVGAVLYNATEKKEAFCKVPCQVACANKHSRQDKKSFYLSVLGRNKEPIPLLTFLKMLKNIQFRTGFNTSSSLAFLLVRKPSPLFFPSFQVFRFEYSTNAFEEKRHISHFPGGGKGRTRGR